MREFADTFSGSGKEFIRKPSLYFGSSYLDPFEDEQASASGTTADPPADETTTTTSEAETETQKPTIKKTKKTK